jgi:superfamily II DNA or RNA helicase
VGGVVNRCHFFSFEKKVIDNINESFVNNSERMDLSELLVPESFDFPFTPYGIQEDFMKKLYETIEKRKIGIFESPTGTGKSKICQ